MDASCMTPLAQLELATGLAWEPAAPTDPSEQKVLRALRDGQRHGRGALVDQTGLPDRTVRAAIEELRRAGWPVCASSDQPGYRLSWAHLDLERLERDLSARALSALKTRSAIRRSRQRRAA